MRVVQFYQALVDFSLLFKDIFVTTMFSKQCRTDPQPILYNTRDLFKWNNSFCLANGCYSRVTAWILLSYAPSLLPHFGHSYNKTESLQFTSAFCPPSNIILEIENWLSQKISTLPHETLANVFSAPMFIKHELPGKKKKKGGVRLWILKGGNNHADMSKMEKSWVSVLNLNLWLCFLAFSHTMESIRGNKST